MATQVLLLIGIYISAQDRQPGRKLRNEISQRYIVSPASAISCLPPSLSSGHSAELPRTHSKLVKFSFRDPEHDKVSNVLRGVHQGRMDASSTAGDDVSRENEPLYVDPPDIDSPITAEVLAKRQELMELSYFDKADARLISLKAACNSPLFTPKVALSNFHVRA